MVGKLVDGDKLKQLAQGLDQRMKDAVDQRVMQPEEEGVAGQILSINDNGDTAWINNSEPISKEQIDAYLDEIFKEEIEAEGEVIEVNQLKMITTTQIDDIMKSVF